MGNTERNKQSRRHDATETFPITSYKVDMKICQTHTLCSCCSERRDRSKAKLEKDTHKITKRVSFLNRKAPSESSSRTAGAEHVEHV